MENPNKGRLRDLESAEHYLGGGSEMGILMLRLDFLTEMVAGDDEELYQRKYEQFLIRKSEEVQKQLGGLVEQ